MRLSFSAEKGKTFWSGNGITVSWLLAPHCLPCCNSNLIFPVIPEFSKRASCTCSTTVSADQWSSGFRRLRIPWELIEIRIPDVQETCL